ncbi:MAG TPA: hypothetical protein VFT82_00355 [Candidatus Paceibacterota bacterium]|nr:hypothetical protein [Candidatus Paceibacterota bacterium]
MLTVTPTPTTAAQPTNRLPKEEIRKILAQAWAKRISDADAMRTLELVASGLLVEEHMDVLIARAKLGDDADEILESLKRARRSHARSCDCMHRRVAGSYGMGRRR